MASVDGIVRFWATETRRELPRSLHLGTESATPHWSPSGRWLVTSTVRDGFEPGEAQFWSMPDLQPTGEAMEHHDGVGASVFSPDGSRLATGSEDATARIWEVPSGKPVTPPMRHRQSVAFLQFSADGTVLATATRAGVVHLWDSRTGLPLMPGRALRSAIVSLHLVPKSHQLAVLTADGALYRWDVAPARQTIEELERLAYPPNPSRQELGVNRTNGP